MKRSKPMPRLTLEPPPVCPTKHLLTWSFPQPIIRIEFPAEMKGLSPSVAFILSGRCMGPFLTVDRLLRPAAFPVKTLVAQRQQGGKKCTRGRGKWKEGEGRQREREQSRRKGTKETAKSQGGQDGELRSQRVEVGTREPGLSVSLERVIAR